MGTIPSRDAPATFFSLRYGTHEVGLIPLTRRYFHEDNKVLRQQFVRMRNDPNVRYHFMRDPKYDMKTLPPATYSEEHLDNLLDSVDETLYNSTAAMLLDVDAPLRPVPCAICFVYVNGREGSECFQFYGRRINIIGYLGCREKEIGPDAEPHLHFRKAILKAAGDRTLERVIALCVTVLKEEFFRAVSRSCPKEDPAALFRHRITKIPVVVSSLWNSYPTLKFLYDSCALSWAIEPLQVASDPPSFEVYEVSESGEKGLKITLSGSLVFRMIMWVSDLLSPSSIRGCWEQLVLNERRTQIKGKTMSKWLETSLYKNSFMGSDELTAQVTNHLSDLLTEIVRAREVPLEDLTLWRKEQECSYDGKLYRIFDSPRCGPFLTTVKTRHSADKKSESSGERKSMPFFNTQQVRSDDSDKQNSSLSDSVLGSSQETRNTRPPPPVYDASVNIRAPVLFVNSPNSAVGSQTLGVPASYPNVSPMVPGSLAMFLPSTKAPHAKQVSALNPPATFLPLFHPPDGAPALPLEAPCGSFVVPGPSAPAAVILNSGEILRDGAGGNINTNGGNGGSVRGASEAFFAPGATEAAAGIGMGGLKLVNAVQPQQMSNFVILPDGRVGMMNPPVMAHTGYWN